jgi:hypothetical protein
MSSLKSRRGKSSAVGHIAVACVAGFLIHLGGWFVIPGVVILIGWLTYCSGEERAHG